MKKRIFSLFIFSLFISAGFAQAASAKKDLVLKVTLDKKNYSSLDQNTKAFVSSAYMKFLQDLTMVPEISVRTPDTDNELREIQKQSQIEAATGLGSEEAAYAADKGIRADLVMNVSLNNAGNGAFQFVCTLSEIETMKLIITENSERLAIAELTKDQVIDNLVYNILSGLNKRGYISSLSADVTNQLLHLDNTAESFQKYVQEYTRQREEAERELAALRADAKTEQERMDAQAQELALQLKIEMAEKNRQIAEENLRRQKGANNADQKRQKEMEQMQNAQREQFMKDIQAIEEARSAIRKETLTSLPLKKRIELIESARGNLSRLENQLAEAIAQNNAYYDEKLQAEIDEINAEPWRKADLSNGAPTQRALNFRSQKINDLRDKYSAQKKSSENQLRSAAKPTIDGYKQQVQANISDMEKTTYVFRSIDVTDDYLSLEVSEFDGERMVWDVYSDFNLNNIQKIDVRQIVLPNTSIPYESMAGNKADLSTDAGYKKYQDTVDMADLYFRTSVPYLYSQIAIKVNYNKSLDIYEAKPFSFQIFKTQDNRRPIISYTERNFEAARRVQEENEKSQVREEKREERREEVAKQTQNVRDSFIRSQRARSGLFSDLVYVNGPFYEGAGASFSILGGGDNFFAGFDNDYFIPYIKSEYSHSRSWDQFYGWSADFVVGYSLRIGFIRPYLAAGIGGFVIGNEELFDTDLYGFQFETITGADVCFSIFSAGFVYKLKYLYGAGYVDNYGVSFGLNW